MYITSIHQIENSAQYFYVYVENSKKYGKTTFCCYADGAYLKNIFHEFEKYTFVTREQLEIECNMALTSELVQPEHTIHIVKISS
jgi:hypothetical protein